MTKHSMYIIDSFIAGRHVCEYILKTIWRYLCFVPIYFPYPLFSLLQHCAYMLCLEYLFFPDVPSNLLSHLLCLVYIIQIHWILNIFLSYLYYLCSFSNLCSKVREENRHSERRLESPMTDVDNFTILIIKFIYALEWILLGFKFYITIVLF